jgi:PilZ domain
LENRKDKRFGERNPVLIKDACLSPGTAASGGFNAFTHDLSVSGARISSRVDYPVGSVIRIDIDLRRTRQSLRVDGEVVWTRKSKNGKRFEIGVEFEHKLPDTILSLIKHFYGKEVGIPSSVS